MASSGSSWVVLGGLLAVLAVVKGRKKPLQPVITAASSSVACEAPFLEDPRIWDCLSSMDAEPERILDVGSGLGDRARMFGQRFPRALVVAMEPHADLSSQASKLTNATGLQDMVLHVRVDAGFAVDPVDITDGKLYDVVFVHENGSDGINVTLDKVCKCGGPSSTDRKGGGGGRCLLGGAWVGHAMKHGAVLLVQTARENFHTTLGVLEGSGLFSNIALCRGLGAGKDRLVREHRQRAIADKNNASSSSSNVGFELEYLIYARRNSTPCSSTVGARSSRVPTASLPVKPAQVRVRDKDGFRTRAGAVVVDHCSSSSPRVLLISSSKRPNEWTLPAGGVEQGETVEQAVLRETLEEAGCVCELGPELVVLREQEKHTETHFCLAILQEERQVFDEQAQRHRLWVDLDDAIKLCSGRSSNFAALQQAKQQLLEK